MSRGKAFGRELSGKQTLRFRVLRCVSSCSHRNPAHFPATSGLRNQEQLSTFEQLAPCQDKVCLLSAASCAPPPSSPPLLYLSHFIVKRPLCETYNSRGGDWKHTLTHTHTLGAVCWDTGSGAAVVLTMINGKKRHFEVVLSLFVSANVSLSRALTMPLMAQSSSASQGKHPRPYVQRHTPNYTPVLMIPTSPLSPSSSPAAPAHLFPPCADFLPHHHDNLIQPLHQNNMTAYVMERRVGFSACCGPQGCRRFVRIGDFWSCQSLRTRSSTFKENGLFLTGAVNVHGWQRLLLRFQMQSRDTKAWLENGGKKWA